MYLLIYSAYLDLLEPGLPDETAEIVSDLFLFPHSSLISKRPSVSGILWSILYKSVTSSSIFKAFCSSLETNMSTSSCPGIVGGVVPVECSLARWNRALYLQIVCGTQKTDEGHIGQWIETLVHGLHLQNLAAD
jgi:hypothetical protein